MLVGIFEGRNASPIVEVALEWGLARERKSRERSTCTFSWSQAMCVVATSVAFGSGDPFVTPRTRHSNCLPGSKPTLLKAMKGHIAAEGEFMGIYQR
jgi:hypothetical protein